MPLNEAPMTNTRPFIQRHSYSWGAAAQSRSLVPELAQLPRQLVVHLPDLAARHAPREHGKHRLDRALEIRFGQARHCLRDVLQKLRLVTVSHRPPGRLPALEVEAAHEGWKLRAKVDGFLGRQPIAQHVQN